MTLHRFAVAAVVVVLLAAPALAQEAKTMFDQDAARLAVMWGGAYDNANQTNEQERLKIPEAAWEARRLKIFKKVDAPAFGPHVTYVEQYLGEPPTSVYRQRIYVHRADAANSRIVTDIYAFRGKDAEKVLGAHKDASKLKGFSPANMDKLPDGCAVFWKAVGDSFEGVQYAESCHYMPAGMSEKIRLSDRIVLSPAALSTQTKMMREDGSMMQGNPQGLPEVSYKARAFSCFLIVRNPDQPNGGPPSGFVVESGTDQTHNVLATVPGQAAYSPLWRVSVINNTDFGSVSNLSSAQGANIMAMNVMNVNCPVVRYP